MIINSHCVLYNSTTTRCIAVLPPEVDVSLLHLVNILPYEITCPPQREGEVGKSPVRGGGESHHIGTPL